MCSSEEVKAARAEYAENYRKMHPEKVKAAQERYWQRRAERLAAERTQRVECAAITKKG